ncbi:MAG: alpha/beta hydrolase [Jaaginema sp. PMC 1079.18]|nr:alpha/beta hydrolase [Jaaginema sp. PMC 1080.18]MEC4850948.1 alpha/beta hydrolase [Jaaginema sp. PMC 1079.18]MEC4867068.1 alpha/beta hydrolase [Jaaginema sp. PMC 1078.18]
MEQWWRDTFPEGRKILNITDSFGNPLAISYGEKGQGSPLICFHGIGSWSYSWRRLIEPFSQHFRVICFDAKGHGFSAATVLNRQIGYQIPEFLQIIHALNLDEPVTVMAQSLGALITLAAVEREPTLFKQLILINVPIFLETLPNWWMPLLAHIPLDFVQWIDQTRLSQNFAPFLHTIVTYGRQEVVVNPQDITPEEVSGIIYPYVNMPGAIATYVNDLQLALKALQAKSQNQPNLMTQIERELATIQQPTLILWGDRDRWFPPYLGEKLCNALPNATLKILQQCGHDGAASAPKQIYRAYQNFRRF